MRLLVSYTHFFPKASLFYFIYTKHCITNINATVAYENTYCKLIKCSNLLVLDY